MRDREREEANEKGKDKGEEKKYKDEIREMEEKKKDVHKIRKTKK